MIEIINADTDQTRLEHLRWMFLSEWGKIDSFDTAVSAVENGDLIGGLVFTSYKKPGSDNPGTWVNALYVVEEHRRRGIASSLIEAAEIQAVHNNECELYAYTDVPDLYIKCGWAVISKTGTHSVLKKDLN